MTGRRTHSKTGLGGQGQDRGYAESLAENKASRIPSLVREGVVVTPAIYLMYFFTATAKSLQSCPTLCDPRDGSPPGSPVPGILQARTLE